MESFDVPDNLSKNQYLFLALLAEKAKRFFEMTKFVDKVVLCSKAAKTDLTLNERDLFASAYKNALNLLTPSWIVVDRIMKEEEDKDHRHWKLAREYRRQIESEVSDVSGRLLKAIEEHLMGVAGTYESMTLYLTLKGECHMCLASMKTGYRRKPDAYKARDAFTKAQEFAAMLLPWNHVKLRLAHSLSKLYYEILDDGREGYMVAKQAFEEVLPLMDLMDQVSYKETRPVVEILRNSLINMLPDVQLREIPPPPPGW